MANEGTAMARECNAAELCRTCMNTADDSKSRRKLVPIFSMVGDVFIANIITQCTAVEIYENDGLPAAICPDCFDTVKLVDAFAKATRNSDAELRQLFKPDSTLKEPDPSDNAGFVEVVEEEVLEEEVLEEIPIEAGTSVTHFLEIKFENAEQMFDETGEEPIELSDDSDSDCIEIDEEEEEPPEELDRLEPGPPRKRSRNPQPRRRKRPIQTEEDLQLSEKEQELFTVIEIPSESHLCCGCLLYFESAEELEAHRLVKHIWKCEYLRKPNSKPSCENCLRQFGTDSGKERHKERIRLLRVIWECKKCHVRFKLPGKRREHLKLHPNDEPKARVARVKETTTEKFGWVCCGILCKATFETEAELIAHGMSEHWADKQAADLQSADKPLQCQVCYQRFVDRVTIARHQRRKYRDKNQQCSRCGLKFISTIDLKAHEVKAHGSDYFKCKICDRNFSLKRTLELHIRTIHMLGKKPRRPQKVPIQTENDQQLSAKEQELFTVIEIPPNRHICCGCLLFFESSEELETHRQMKHVRKNVTTMRPTSKHTCEGCLRLFGTTRGMQYHKTRISMLKVVWECKKCKIMFKLPGKRREHAKLHTDGDPVALVVRVKATTKQALGWVCCGPICSQSFSTEEELIAHGRTSHWIDRKAADLEHADRPEQCQVCFQRFLDRKQIFAHQRRKYKIKKIKCTLCGQAVSSKTELKRHEVKVHNVDGFKCEICGKSYPSASSLTSHIKLMHVKGAQHMCTICGKTFRQSGGLSIHMSCHVEVPQFKCEICLKMFKHKLHLRYHMRTHTGEKPYKCRYCDSAFANHTNWRRHEMTHTGDKPHNCSYCEKSFILRRSLLEHEASHTGGPKPIRKARNRQTKAQPKGGQVDENMRVVEVDDEYFSSSSSDSTADNLQQQQQQNAAVASIADQPQTVQSAVYAMYNVVPTASGYVVK